MNEGLQLDAFLLGAPKCGTTWLSSALEQHPGLCVSDPKEPNEIATHKGTMIRDDREPDFTRYKKFFKGKGKKIDCSVHAFACPKAPIRIKKNWPGAKFLICVREPFSRTISHWKMIRETEKDIHSGADWSDFENAWQDPRLCKDSLYGECFQNWISEFPRSSFLIIDAKQLREEPEKSMQMVCEHLEIENYEFDFDKISNSNKAEDRKKPTSFNRKLMAFSSKIPNFLKMPIAFPLKILGINIYNSKALTSTPDSAEVDVKKAQEIMSAKVIADIQLFESLSGNSYQHWR